MTDKNPEISASGLKLEDIYYTLFRHKWKIAVFSAMGILAAAILFFGSPPVYQSEAKLLIKYVQESKSVSPVKDASQIKSPDDSGENIINSELEILTSLDLARQVAELVGPEKILAKAGGGNSIQQAAGLIRRGLTPDVPRKSNIIRLVFQHPDPEVVQPVLERLIEVYLKKHLEIHRAIGILDDFLSQQTDQVRARLTQTEDDLKKMKTKAGIISLDDSKKAFIEQLSKLNQDLLTAEAELEERKAALKEIEKLMPSNSATNAAELGVSLEKLGEYRNVCAQLATLVTTNAVMLLRYTEENPVVQRVQTQIAETEKIKKKMEEENPKLLSLGISSAGTMGKSVDLSSEVVQIKGLEARMSILNSQLQKIGMAASSLDAAESDIVRLQRQKELEEANYRFYSSSLEQARIDETLGAGKVTNINTVQAPSPPSRDTSKLMKPAGLALAGGIFGGIGLAFLIELFLKQSLRRPGEIETHLRLPLFLSIPDTATGRRFLLSGFVRALPLPFFKRARSLKAPLPPHGKELSAGEMDLPNDGQPLQIAPWDSHHQLRSYFDALRDRLITWFEARNLTHRPKLVAITSCSKGSGVSTIATGLAASLSDIGGYSVLLVDMNHHKGAAHPFYHGKPGCTLHEALEQENREVALVQQNLYVVSGNGTPDNLPRAMPKRFAHLMPKMKASNYDYIIFDMPPVNQTSVTPRLAGFMDTVLMVVEAEKTNRHAAKRATESLRESNPQLAAIINRAQNYVPDWLHQDL